MTTGRTSRPLASPFVVIATQNPVEHHGTYPLPESQLDRFLMRLHIGYPEPESFADRLQELRDRVGGDRAAVAEARASVETLTREAEMRSSRLATRSQTESPPCS